MIWLLIIFLGGDSQVVGGTPVAQAGGARRAVLAAEVRARL